MLSYDGFGGIRGVGYQTWARSSSAQCRVEGLGFRV